MGEKMIGWQSPEVLTLPRDSKRFEELKSQAAFVHDEIHLALGELFDIENPAQKDTKTQSDIDEFVSKKTEDKPELYGSWIYFPWSARLVHFPPVHELRALRTSRNRNLVTSDEQQKLYGSTVMIAGMSVGSNIVEALISQGIGGKLIIIDMDILEPSNLNRIRAPYHQVGLHKIDAVAQKISETDPYIEQIHYKKGLDPENLKSIIDTHKPDVLVDEMDDVRMKLLLRHEARTKKLPVVMAADDGDGILLDVERYDTKDDLPILHGNVPEAIEERILSGEKIPRPELGMMIGKYFVGFENTPLRMFESLAEVGKTLPSWPQLGGAAALAGIMLAYCVKRIVLGQPLNDGRFLITPDEKLNPEIDSPEYKAKLQNFIERLSAL